MHSFTVLSKIIAALFVYFEQVEAQNSFIAKHYQSDNYACVTNSSFALSWIIEGSLEKLDQVSKFIPTQAPNSFDNTITENPSITPFLQESWSLRNNLDLSNNEVILDRRWEEFPTLVTEGVDEEYARLQYLSVAESLNDNFEIPLSIRIEKEAHIFLCDGKSPPRSNCYWFLIQAWKGNGSAIRKCPEGYIKSLDREYPKPPCSTTLTRIDHPSKYPYFLFTDKWAHLKISKHNNVFTFIHRDSYGKENEILRYEDANPIKVTNMIIHSKIYNGLWKIHTVDFIYTNEDSFKIRLGPLIYSQTDYVCVSMFISMCNSCKIVLTLADYKGGGTAGEETFYFQNSGWSEIKFMVEKTARNTPYVLLVSTVGGNPDKFWAIDKIRLCQKIEFRSIHLTAKATCQLMSNKDDVLTLSESLSKSASTCPENTISKFCIPCDWLFEDCQRITLCQKDECVCSAGYTETSSCYSQCSGYSYGHGCRKHCGNCYYSGCNHIDGNCTYNSCSDDYTGPRCDIPPAIIFDKPPDVTPGYSSAVVAVKKFEFQKGLIDEEPTIYYIQFKKDMQSEEWNFTTSAIPFGTSTVVTIDNLEADTSYFVRAIIATNTGQIYDGPYVKFQSFTTKCRDISPENIEVVPSNISVVITQKSEEVCKLSRYNAYIKPQSAFGSRVDNPNSMNDTLLYFNKLKPFTYYIVTFHEMFNITFRTTEGVPAQISDFQVIDKSSTKIEIQWSNQTELWGNFQHYVVDYELVSYVACHGVRISAPGKISLKTQNSSAVIQSLTPYATYSFSVYAANTKFDGLPVIRQISTLASPSVGRDEIPGTDIEPQSNSVQVKLKSVCEKVKGPILVKTSAKCSNDWCTKGREPKEISLESEPQFYIDDLIPFSNYTLEVGYCRDQSNCNNYKTYTFRTEPTVPNAVRDLLVYSKDESSISLRWRTPYPPNGILKDYKIDFFYYHSRSVAQSMNIEIQPCTLWQDFHCTELSELEGKKTYTVTIRARNEQPLEFGAEETVTTITQKESPGPPYDLVTKWTPQNDLELEWKHPNRSNGHISHFQIVLTSPRKSFTFNDTYQLIYHYTIASAEMAPTTSYNVQIAANNGKPGTYVYTRVTSPPDIPKLETELDIDSSDNATAEVIITPQKIHGLSDTYFLILLISEEGSTNSRTVFNCSVNATIPYNLTVGDNKRPTNCAQMENPPLRPATRYNITVVLVNTYQNQTRYGTFWKMYMTKGKPIIPMGSSLLGLLALLLLIPVAAVIYLKWEEVMSLKTSLMSRNNPSTEFLEIQEDQIPLSNVPKKVARVQPKPQSETNPDTIHSKSIKITDFEEYVKESIVNGELERQHAIFPRGQTKPWKCASLKENKSKNRYNNLLAYDHSRVILEKVDGIPNSDYINANYIDGHKVPRAYIATQGPKASTLDDFWRMIWQENVRHIVNLANIYEGGKKKVEKYWPDINEILTFGQTTVQHVSTKVYADYEYRVFTVTHDEETRKVDQLHFSSWPDHGVPLYSQSLVPFLQKMLQQPISAKSPIVVHCSAGVGRTGTILLCDICLRMAAREGHIDVLRNLQLLRDQRANMVDNIEQYKLAHLVVLECLVGLHTSIQCNEIDKGVRKVLENGSLTLQMRYLKDTQWQDQAMKSVGQTGGEVPIVREKNRFENIVPEIQGRIFLSRYPPDDDTSTYINAVKVDGFRSPGRFIVTQQPLPKTLGDFWRLIDETNVTVIISLNEINPKDKTSCFFWPSTNQPQLDPVPHITLKHVNTQSVDCYNVTTIHLMAKSRKDHLPVRIVEMKKWPAKSKCPTSVEQFLAFWEEADSVSRQSHPVVVTCYDGVKASGLYVALSFIIEKMKLEQVCDVCQAVRTVRHNRDQFVQEVEQFEFLYKAAVLFINGFESYANFN